MAEGLVKPNTFTFEVKPTKRYRMIFSIWGHINSDSISDFDDIDELEEEKKLIKEYYNSTPRPEKVYKGEKTYRYDKRKYEISYENGGCYWGYITLDYQDKKILEIYNDGCRIYHTSVSKKAPYVGANLEEVTTKIPYVIDKKKDRRRIMDLFFRTEDDVPADYKWDDGEYEGWLQFKWGDGKNAIDYIEPVKEKISDTEDDFDEDDVFEEYIDKNEEIATTLEDQLHEETMKRLRNKWYEY